MAALALLLPAATAKNTPAETTLAAAELTAVDLAPPRDMLATAPLGQLRVLASLATKLIPAMTPELVPLRLVSLESRMLARLGQDVQNR